MPIKWSNLQGPFSVLSAGLKYLIGTNFYGHLISQKWKRTILQDLKFAICQESHVKGNLFLRKVRIHIHVVSLIYLKIQ